MFKKLYILISASALMFSSCDDFLDKMPDNRTELDTPEKISKILVSAYPDASNAKMCECYSDNYAENQVSYTIFNFCEVTFFIASCNAVAEVFKCNII